jgi:hypothetical protein
LLYLSRFLLARNFPKSLEGISKKPLPDADDGNQDTDLLAGLSGALPGMSLASSRASFVVGATQYDVDQTRFSVAASYDMHSMLWDIENSPLAMNQSFDFEAKRVVGRQRFASMRTPTGHHRLLSTHGTPNLTQVVEKEGSQIALLNLYKSV